MNGALYDATFNIFFKLKYAKLYDAVLATPVTPADVAECVLFVVTRPAHVNVDELVVKALAQSSPARIVRD